MVDTGIDHFREKGFTIDFEMVKFATEIPGNQVVRWESSVYGYVVGLKTEREGLEAFDMLCSSILCYLSDACVIVGFVV